MPRLADPPAARRPPPRAEPPAEPRPAPKPPLVPAAPRFSPAAGRATLRGVTWDEYVALRDKPENEHVKMIFDGPAGGLLEIEMPNGNRHESVSRLVCLLVASFAEERELELKPDGSVSLRRQDLARGADCDESFYVSSYEVMHDHDGNVLDLDGDELPPDLVVEIDVTNPGVSKLPICAAIGVAEVWVWEDETLIARRLTEAGSYEIVAGSVELPGFPLAVAAGLIARRAELPTFRLTRLFREALRNAG